MNKFQLSWKDYQKGYQYKSNPVKELLLSIYEGLVLVSVISLIFVLLLII